MEQILTYLGIMKVRSLPFLKLQPRMWKIEHIGQWLKAIDLAHCQFRFEKNKISGNVLLDLKEDDLRHELSMKLGERKRFLRALSILKNLHSPKLKKEKRTLKHLKNYKKASTPISNAGTSSPTTKSPNFKTPNSLNKFVPSMSHDPIV